MNRRGIVDLSSVIWTCLKGGKDVEFGRKCTSEAGKEQWVNSATYAYEHAINHIIKVMQTLNLQPRDLILVKEGMNSKQERQNLLETYKSKRDKLPEEYEEFNKAREMFAEALCNLGAQLCWQDHGVEADDVIGYLALNLHGQRWIISGDKDLAQMVGAHPNIHHYRMGEIDTNPFGPFLHQHIPTWIALVGDGSDGIPGAKGFGQKSGEELLMKFGDEGLTEMTKLIRGHTLERLVEDVPAMKKLQCVVDDAPNVYLSYELGRLRIEKINTMRRPLSWAPGMVKPRRLIEDKRLQPYGGIVKLIHQDNFEQALAWAAPLIAQSPYVTLDVETSTPPESDEWLEMRGKTDKVDVFGSTLTSLQLTFGLNMQYTVYLPHDNVQEADVRNLTVDQILAFVDCIPREKFTVAHGAHFELPICYMTWGEKWKDDQLHHGFLRNCIDSRIMSSYVDENRSAGLKNLSKTLFNYDQVSYDAVTTKVHKKADWNPLVGKLVGEFKDDFVYEDKVVKLKKGYDEELYPDGTRTEQVVVSHTDYVRVQYKMNHLKAREVLAYGADDTICTAAVTNHFMTIMEIENTWDVFMECEQWPAYMTALAFVQGVPFSLEEMRAMEMDDDAAYDKAWPDLRSYLIKVGFEGTVCPVFDEVSPANVKQLFQVITGPKFELKTGVRLPEKLAKLIEQEADSFQEMDMEDVADTLRVLSTIVAAQDVTCFNALMQKKYDCEPQLDLASPPQMCTLLYDVMKLPVNMVNNATDLERMHKPDLAKAIGKFKRKRAGHDVTMLPEELALVRKKAKSDDTAIDYALAFDSEFIEDDARAALKAIGTMKTVMTRRSLFYNNYRNTLHWKDNLLHASINQCAAITRRYSASDQNVTQLPKLGDGARFRNGFQPHNRKALVFSADFSGQELRISAEISQDKNLLDCYVGENLKDVHSITAAGAMRLKWGAEFVAQAFDEFGVGLDRDEEGEYKLFVTLKDLGKTHVFGKKADDLRKVSKNVNFGSVFLAKAPTLADTLVMTIADATLFLDARNARFPGLNIAAEASEGRCRAAGYSLTLMGARRHLAHAIGSSDSGAAARAARQAWNFEVQASAAEMVKLSMTRVWKSQILWTHDMRFYFPVHDELVGSAHQDCAVEVMRVIHDCMVKPYATMKVPILSSLSIGANYGEQIECGDWFIQDRLEAAVRKVFPKNDTIHEEALS